MKKTYKIQALSVLILLMGVELHAQFTEGRINLYAGYSMGTYRGDSLINEDGFVTPALYPNFSGMNGWMVKALAGGNKYIRIGAGFDHVKARGWEYHEEIDYEGSEMVMNSYSLIAQFRTKLARAGILNRISVCAELAPVVGTARLTLSHPLVDIESEDDSAEQPMETSDLFAGGRVAAGFECLITNTFGFYISCSYNFQQVDSKLYHDDRIISPGLDAGFIVRLMNDKRYYY